MAKLKTLLLEAPYSYGKDNIVVGKYYSLGVGYLAANIRKYGYPIKIFQPTQDNNFDKELIATIKDYRPDLVGISVMTTTYPKAVDLCSVIKKNSTSWTVLGGHHISALSKDILDQSKDTDFAVIGEGETTIIELIEAVGSNRKDFSKINGLLWRDENGGVNENKMRGFVKDLDTLPFPARDLVDLSRFRIHSYIDFGKRSATMITSRGCPYKCMFCSSHLTMGSFYRFRSAENVLAEIEELTNKYKVDHIVFEDDTLTFNRDRLEAICEGLIRMPKGPSWYCLSRVDTMDRELAKLMKRSGCRMVGFGIESGSPEVLEKINKKISIPKAIEAVRACREVGMRTLCTFIVGFPFDTEETIEMTYDAAKVIDPTMAIFFPLTPYPGTPVYENFLSNKYRPRNLENWADFIMTCNNSGVSVNEEFSGKELKRIADSWNRRFYFRPRQIGSIAKTIHNTKEFLNIFRGFLSVVNNTLTSKI